MLFRSTLDYVRFHPFTSVNTRPEAKKKARPTRERAEREMDQLGSTGLLLFGALRQVNQRPTQGVVRDHMPTTNTVDGRLVGANQRANGLFGQSSLAESFNGI